MAKHAAKAIATCAGLRICFLPKSKAAIKTIATIADGNPRKMRLTAGSAPYRR